MCPFCDKVYDQSEYSHFSYCSGELEDDEVRPCPECGGCLHWDGEIWECSNCGHIHVGEKALQLCPVCKHPQGYFKIKAQNY